MSLTQAAKNYEAYREIHTSHEAMLRTVEAVDAREGEIRDFFAGREELVFVACGSSYWMSLSAAALMARRCGKRAVAVKAGDVVLHPDDYKGLYDRPTLVLPSRSGKSKEALEAVAILKGHYPGLSVFSVTIAEDNDMAPLSDLNLSIPFANEVSVCQTRSFNCLSTAFVAIANLLSGEGRAALRGWLDRAPALYRRAEALAVKVLGDGLPGAVVALGSGMQYGVVIEGAYIVIEMAELPSNYYHVMEYRHGPIVTAGEDTLVCVCSSGGRARPFEERMAAETLAHGARVVFAGDAPGPGHCTYPLDVGADCPPEIACLFFVTFMQSLACHLSVALGRDPDNPGELVRYITF